MTWDLDHEGKTVPGHQKTISAISEEDGQELLTKPDKVSSQVGRYFLKEFKI